MSNVHDRSDRDHPQNHRRNNRDCSPHTKVSECSDVDGTVSGSAEHGSRHVSQYHSARRGAVDFGQEPRDDRPRRGAVDFGRGSHDDLTLSESEDSKDSEGFNRMRRGSAAARDDFRGFLASRGSERRLTGTVREKGNIEPRLPVQGEGLRRWHDLRGRSEHLDRRSDRTSCDARVDGEDDFEPRELRRATPLARYVYYEPHGPRSEAGPGPSRS